MLILQKTYEEIIKDAMNNNIYEGFEKDAMDIINQSKAGKSFPEVEILYIRLGLKENF